MTLFHSTLVISFVALAVLQSTSVSAATCTEDEQSTINSVHTDLASSAVCADLISDSDATSLDYCMKSDCISELSAAVDKLPECTSEDETNRKTGLQAIITNCADVAEVSDRSPSASDDPDSVVSSASQDFLATGALFTQFSVALYFFAGLL
ncbi:unnamed protein product [Peronospora belbahrii]|uniref:Elicitin-like protein n=1 Tax=Peronospora belbahrii TaxID=622444 RepID=A0AAU9LBW1_9STRA|nr:unnamed protein product [Peronospora belbahrii]CAH0514417.1 unnamed protein product [Peronospora belbahrii]